MPAYGCAMIGRKLALTPMANRYQIALRSRARGGYDDRMIINHLNPFTAADADALLALHLDNDDDLNIDYLDLTILLSRRIAESTDAESARDFLLSRDICPMHECDFEICRDDRDDECAELRA